MDVLILGGTEFMGRTLVETLLTQGHKVTLLNRGNEYWKSQNPFEGKVERIICDRTKEKMFKEALEGSIKGQRTHWDLVVDFSAYDEDDMQPSVEVLNGKVKHYVYISSDSVYMVCDKPAHNEPRKETDAVRPKDPSQQEKLNEFDSYGHGKLECEEVLQRYPEFPYTCLRLPDVYGPYDTTDRHWKYQLWVKVSENFPVDITKEAKDRKLGFVYSRDVVSAVLAVQKAGSKTFGQAYNIAHVEHVTLEEYLTMVAENLNVSLCTVLRSEEKSDSSDYDSDSSSSSVNEFLPSVNFGPISIEKALRELQWQPTPIKEAVATTVNFFEEAYQQYPSLRPLQDFNSKLKTAIEKAYDTK